jgi:hypothetical protein
MAEDCGWCTSPSQDFSQMAGSSRRSAAVPIGAIVLEDLDLLVDCSTQLVVPRDPRGAIYEIESSSSQLLRAAALHGRRSSRFSIPTLRARGLSPVKEVRHMTPRSAPGAITKNQARPREQISQSPQSASAIRGVTITVLMAHASILPSTGPLA